MRCAPLDFPAVLPSGYRELDQEPRFDPKRHLALEPPSHSWSLEALGYDAGTIATASSPLAITGAFRILSEEGAATLEAVALALRRHALTNRNTENFDTNRTQTYLAGGVYRSRFLRDLCHAPEILAFCSELAETPLAPHSLPSQQIYINYAPEKLETHVDNWHADSIGIDYVLLASDPKSFTGGAFKFFRGTRDEAAALLDLPEPQLNRGRSEGIPDDRVEEIPFPARGYAVLQQGHFVVHRARRLKRPAQRVTVVPGLIPLETGCHDPTDLSRIATYGEPGIAAEIARHGAWRARAKLRGFLDAVDMDGDADDLRLGLSEASADIARALEALGQHQRASAEKDQSEAMGDPLIPARANAS